MLLWQVIKLVTAVHTSSATVTIVWKFAWHWLL